MEPSDEELLAHYRGGFRDALGALMTRHKRALYGFITAMARQEDAEEIFQETWFRAIRNFDSYRRRNFRSWLFRIGHNLVIDRARARRKMTSLDAPMEGETQSGGSLAEVLPAPGPDPAEEAARRDVRRRVRVAVGGLPAEQRAVFLMRWQSDLPFREIARIQGVPLGTALARMQYAVNKLRLVLREEGQP